MAIEIQAILDTLGRYKSPDSIQRRLLEIAKTLRNSSSSQENQRTLGLEKQALEIARMFLNSKWITTQLTSSDYLSLLTQWFQEEECTVEDKDFLAVSCLYKHFQSELVNEHNPMGLVMLGESFFYEPIKFTAFILWLLDKENPQAIIESKLLHVFIATHFHASGDKESPLHKVYALLRMSDKENVKSLLALADKTYSGLRGSAKNQPQGGQFKSSNLSGGEFQHLNITEADNIPCLPLLNFSSSNENIDALWRLFKMDLIRVLDLDDIKGQQIMTHLLSMYAERILPGISAAIINGQINPQYADKLLSVIANIFENDPPKYLPIFQQHPFYLQALPFAPSLLKQIGNFIEQVEKYLNSVNAPINSSQAKLLVGLSCFFENQHLAKSTVISAQVFKLFMQSEELSEEASEAFKRLPHLEDLSISKLQELTEKLDQTLTTDEEQVYYQWSALLAKTNMLKSVTSNVNHLSRYPFNKNELLGFIIESKFIRALLSGEIVNLSELIESAYEKTRSSTENLQDNTKRLLLETLVYTQNSELQQTLITELETKGINWPNEQFGGQSLLSRAVFRGNAMLMERLIKLTGDNSPNREALREALCSATKSAQWSVVTLILNLTGNNALDQAAVSKAQEAVRHALCSAVSEGQWSVVTNILILTGYHIDQETLRDTLRSAASVGQLSVVTHILNLTRDDAPDRNATRYVLRFATSAGQLSVVTHILNLTGDNAPDREVVGEALCFAAEAGLWTLVTYILNLTGDKAPDRKVVREALSVAAKAGQLSVVTHILNLTGDNAPEREGMKEALFSAASAGQLAVVIHFLNLTGDNALNRKAVEKALGLAAYTGKLSVVIHILNLAGDKAPDQEAVGEAMLSAAKAGQWFVVTHILKFTGDNAPDREIVEKVRGFAERRREWHIIPYLVDLIKDNKPSEGTLQMR